MRKFQGTYGQYIYLHKWVAKHKTRPIECVSCGATSKIEWSNISGKYLKDLSDYEPLCVPCHRKKDLGGVPKNKKEFCIHGHKMTQDNTRLRVNYKGFTYRICRECVRIGARRRYASL